MEDAGDGSDGGGRAAKPLPRVWPEALLGFLALAALTGLTAVDVLLWGGPSWWLPLALLAAMALLVVRAVALRRGNRRLAEGYRATDDFKTQLLRFISHEIANPLSPLKLQSDVLRQGAPDPVRSWSIMDRSIARLESLSRDVRLMALAETGRIVQETKPGDLRPRVAGAVQTFHGLAAQRGSELRSELPPAPLVVPVDGERFDQVVDNLLSNAVKFTPKGGTIAVRLFRSPTGWAVFEVADTGAGMDADQLARLFSAFGRRQGSSTPGLGLGLYLCKAIVEGHGGRISATSEGPGRGSRFRFELPPATAAPRAAASPAPDFAPAVHGGGPSVPGGRPPDLPL